ncbi:hypothetical protein [Winogradskyella sp. 3972H.M.0a.05]|uniref:hypothetical protein n=1 Tax=Winogradskyella sp. 3972H.M.0a.05 TaxID=2950277 RepID=UPI0033974EA4
MTEIEFTVREPKTSLVFKAFAAFILAVYSTVCYYFLTTKEGSSESAVYLIALGFIVMRYMVLPSFVLKSIHFNFSESKIQRQTSLGPISFKGKWKALKALEYISVFQTGNGYEIRLWHTRTKTLNLFALEDYDEALKQGFYFSEKLNIDLLDARERGNHRWVDKEAYRTTGEVVYTE